MKVTLVYGNFLNTTKGNIINIECFTLSQFYFFPIVAIMVSRNSSITYAVCCLHLDCFQLKNWRASFICTISFFFFCNLFMVSSCYLALSFVDDFFLPFAMYFIIVCKWVCRIDSCEWNNRVKRYLNLKLR